MALACWLRRPMGGMYLEWRDHQTVFSSLTAMRPSTQCDLQISHTERVRCVAVQQNFLTTLGVAPLIGRNFTRDEDEPHAPRTMLISDRIWREYFGAQPDVVGKVVDLDDGRVRIIGVLPAEFRVALGRRRRCSACGAIGRPAPGDPASTIFLRAFARLKPGLPADQARQRMSALFRSSIQTTVPADVRQDIRPVIRSVRDRITHEAKLASRMLLGAVALLLLMVCVTVTKPSSGSSACNR